jgi:hypothetical protein
MLLRQPLRRRSSKSARSTPDRTSPGVAAIISIANLTADAGALKEVAG